jgi:hypothetical protein
MGKVENNFQLKAIDEPSWGTCTAPAVQDLGKRLEYFFSEIAAIELFS